MANLSVAEYNGTLVGAHLYVSNKPGHEALQASGLQVGDEVIILTDTGVDRPRSDVVSVEETASGLQIRTVFADGMTGPRMFAVQKPDGQIETLSAKYFSLENPLDPAFAVGVEQVVDEDFPECDGPTDFS